MHPVDPVMRGFDAMGTRFECVLGAFTRPPRPGEPQAAGEEVEFLVRDWHRRLTVFDAASPVSVVNGMGAQRWVTVDQELFALIDRCVGYWRDTRGAFDVAVGALMHVHGLREGVDPECHAHGSALLRLDERTSAVRFAAPGVALDFGGIAKGFALDLAREELAALGVGGALVHGGTSSVLGMGAAPDARPWRVRAAPGDPDAPVVDLTDRCVSVSSTDDRPHVMDPRTGDPAPRGLCACVVGPSGEVCEAWSTALIVDPSLVDTLPPAYAWHVRTGGVWRSGGVSEPFHHPSVCAEVPLDVRL